MKYKFDNYFFDLITNEEYISNYFKDRLFIEKNIRTIKKFINILKEKLKNIFKK